MIKIFVSGNVQKGSNILLQKWSKLNSQHAPHKRNIVSRLKKSQQCLILFTNLG